MTKEAGRPQLQAKLPEFYAVHALIHNNSRSESKKLSGAIVSVHCHWGRAEFWTSTETPEDDMRAIASLLVVLTAVASTAVAILPTSSLAEAWPQRNVRIITPFPAGTGADISARLFAERLALRWEKPVIVENKPGADGILAVTAVVGARDGHTLLYTNGGPVTANPFTHDKLPYDAARDLSPISSAADVAIAISIPSSLNLGTIAEFIAFARSRQGALNWGATTGVLDFFIPGFFKNAGLNLTKVSYREVSPALQDLAEARIQLYASALATQLPMVHAGKIKVLALTNRERSSLVPDVPTVTEAGHSDIAVDGFLGFYAPSGTSADLVDHIGADIRAVGSDPAIAARLSSNGLTVRTSTPAEFLAIVETERAKIAGFAKMLGSQIKP
jgi:tripartite-type tricarboxylate transporter receptor subunit TctC